MTTPILILLAVASLVIFVMQQMRIQKLKGILAMPVETEKLELDKLLAKFPQEDDFGSKIARACAKIVKEQTIDILFSTKHHIEVRMTDLYARLISMCQPQTKVQEAYSLYALAVLKESLKDAAEGLQSVPVFSMVHILVRRCFTTEESIERVRKELYELPDDEGHPILIMQAVVEKAMQTEAYKNAQKERDFQDEEPPDEAINNLGHRLAKIISMQDSEHN